MKLRRRQLVEVSACDTDTLPSIPSLVLAVTESTSVPGFVIAILGALTALGELLWLVHWCVICAMTSIGD
jgi:hypothetical protein